MRFWKYIAAVLLILFAGGPALQAMPPHPDLLEKFRKEGRADSFSKRVSAVQSKSGMNISRASSLASGTLRIPVLLVRYSDVNFNTGVSTTAFYSNLMNGAVSTDISVKKYYREMSNGRLTIQFDFFGPVELPETLAYYGSNVSGDDAHPGELVNKAVNLLVAASGASTDFSIYDNDNNGTVDTIIIIHCGPGEETPAGGPNDIWSHQWDLASAENYGDGDGSVATDGVVFNVYTIQPEYNSAAGDSTIGVFCHELGHVLGLPDLYDTSYATNGVGDWSLMGSGSWGDDAKGTRPAPLLAWERFKIGGSGWINLSSITPGVIKYRYDKWFNLLFVILIAFLVIIPASAMRLSPVMKGVTASVSFMIITTVLSCGSESTSSTRISGTINDIEAGHHAFRIGLNDPYNAQYIFIEGKKASNLTTEWYVPGTGILITHIHEGIINSYSSAGAVNNGSSRVHGVNIVEASTSAEPGELWTDPGYNGTAADLFCQENNSSLTVSTVPGSTFYTGSAVTGKTGDSGVVIENISSNSSFPMTFTASIE